MISMTGFGKAKMKYGSAWVKVEISSVNRKQLETIVGLPREWAMLERQVREWVAEFARRGRVQVTVELEAPSEWVNGKVDVAVARHYERIFRQLIKELKLKNEITLQEVLAAPGVLNNQLLGNDEKVKCQFEFVVKKALKEWSQMRKVEGDHLKKDFLHRTRRIRSLKKKIQIQAPWIAKKYGERLKERLRQANVAVAWEDEVFRKELLFFAERCDISEELTRLESHLQQFEETIKKEGEVGRKLEFLLQEIFREVNTMGAKANDVKIAHEVMELKMEIEKLREQVQNVE
ncbi:MAG: YicC family protein [Verrucomicrobiae bacterium]|nr:YicC family protein [Verrucomicrobiae bacterium]